VDRCPTAAFEPVLERTGGHEPQSLCPADDVALPEQQELQVVEVVDAVGRTRIGHGRRFSRRAAGSVSPCG
jgi:hypothetical protein